MKSLGLLVMALSAALLIYAVTMDISVAVDYPDKSAAKNLGMPDRVVNLSLIEQKHTYTYVSLGGIIVGLLLVIADRKKGTDKLSKQETEYYLNKYTCRNCNETFELENETIDEGKFVCPNCNYENVFDFVDLKA